MAEAIAQLAGALSLPQKPKEPEPSKLLQSFGKLVETVLPTLIMFGVGYYFIQSVELTQKQNEFQASAAEKLREYVEDLIVYSTADESSIATHDAKALSLGGFGAVSVVPLLSIMERGEDQRIASAKLGLLQAARIAPERTCPTLAAVIADRSGAYEWQTGKAVVEIAGLAGCQEALGALEKAQSAGPVPNLTSEQNSNFAKEVSTAIDRIKAASGG